MAVSRVRVFVDADALLSGAVAPAEQGDSHLVLCLGEIHLIDAVTSRQAVIEAERTLAQKLPRALSAFRLLVDRALVVVPDPDWIDLIPYQGAAGPRHLPILVAALQSRCTFLLSHDPRHFRPGHASLSVLSPEFVLQLREHLSRRDAGCLGT